VRLQRENRACKAEIFFSRGTTRETLLARARASRLGVVSSAAAKTRTVETSGHADAARRAHTVLPCVSWGTSPVACSRQKETTVRLLDTLARRAITWTNERKHVYGFTRGKTPADLERKRIRARRQRVSFFNSDSLNRVFQTIFSFTIRYYFPRNTMRDEMAR